MTAYGIRSCLVCFGYGVKLTIAEFIQVKGAIMTGIMPNEMLDIKRTAENCERCPECKGTGWRFAADEPSVKLSDNTLKRW